MKKIDFNLLAIFDAVMMEESIVGAAKRLSMTQPAVSNAVMRMRHAYDNPLFIKHGRGIKPTAFALNLWEKVHLPLNEIQSAIHTERLSPKLIKRRFRIALPDILVDLVWLPLRKIIEQQAPNVDLLAVPLRFKGRERILLDGKADLVISLARYLHRADRKTFINKPTFVCAMRNGHPLAKKRLDLKRFVAAEHLLVTSEGDDSSYIDELLNNKGLSRRVSLTVNHYAVVPNLIKNTDLITVIDKLAIASAVTAGQIITKVPPLDFEELPLCIAWHARHDNDKMLHWLKDQLVALITKVNAND